MNTRRNLGKCALRQAFLCHVSRELGARPKTGFGIAVGQWLGGPLRGWTEDLLDEWWLRREGCFNPAPILKAWTPRYDWITRLLRVLTDQAWLEARS